MKDEGPERLSTFGLEKNQQGSLPPPLPRGRSQSQNVPRENLRKMLHHNVWQNGTTRPRM